MAKTKKEPEVAKEEPREEPKVDNTVDKLKIKKPKKFSKASEEKVTKIDIKELAKKAEEVVKVDLKKPEEISKPEEIKEPENIDEKTPLLEEIKEEDVKPIKTPEEPKMVLPENVQKLMNFMNETGGDINDYVNLNQDYEKWDNDTLLREYYKKTKPHLNNEEVDFIIEDKFLYDNDSDDEKEIKRKKLALKEQVADARQHLDGLKSKYYEELKSGSKLTEEQQKAIEFFNRYNEESENNEKAKNTFLNKTDEVFNDEFKGFEYKVGDKKYRFNVNNIKEIKDKQSDIKNFIGKFLNEEQQMEDASGYHKSLFTAMNADQIANHFYEQGKADALKQSAAQAKNVDMDPRQSHGDNISVGGLKFKALNDDAPDFKFKFKGKKNK
tara:strand:+ start:316 stop:1464 length:1149 start_codon:yes stop_codon:yes gene_type:complete